MNNCKHCGGFVGEPGTVYGYAGKWCWCGWSPYYPNPSHPKPNSTEPVPSIQDLVKRIEELERAVQKQSSS